MKSINAIFPSGNDFIEVLRLFFLIHRKIVELGKSSLRDLGLI